jgi:hypothetical protein
MQHYLHYHDSRFAQNSRFLFYCYDTKQGQQVLTSMALYVKNHPQTFSEFAAVVGDEEFTRDLNTAVARPNSKTAKKVISKVSPFLRAVGSQVDYGPLQRNGSMGRMLAMIYRYGLPSFFVTTSPDEVSVRGGCDFLFGLCMTPFLPHLHSRHTPSWCCACASPICTAWTSLHLSCFDGHVPSPTT